MQSAAATLAPSQPVPDPKDTIPAIRSGSSTAQHGTGSRQAALPKTILGPAEAPGAASGAGGTMLQQLKADLVAEQARRKQAEQDFQVCSFCSLLDFNLQSVDVVRTTASNESRWCMPDVDTKACLYLSLQRDFLMVSCKFGLAFCIWDAQP